MAHSEAYLVDPSPSDPRVIAMMNFPSADGTDTGGLDPSVYPDPASYLSTHLDPLITLGVKYACLNRPFGNHTTANRHCSGHYPFDYPVSAIAGQHLLVDLQTQGQCEERLGSTTYTSNLKAALDTPGRIGSVYGIYTYMAPLAGDYVASAPNLLVDTELISYLGLKPIFDVQSVLSNTNSAPPPIMGANCLLWCEADKLTYTGAGTGLTTTNNAVIQRWESLTGSLSWDQTTAGLRPLLKTGLTNGGKTFSALLFDGTDDMMTLSARQTMGAEYTIVAVVKLPSANGVLLSNSGAPRNGMRFNETGAGSLSEYDGTGVVASNTGQFTANTWAVVRFRYDGTNCRMFLNGTQVSGYFLGPASTADQLIDSMGNQAFAPAAYFSGHVAALALIDKECTDNQIGLIEQYWALKYGISVSGSPTLPQLALVNDLTDTYTIPVYRENFSYRTISSLSSWDADGAGILDADWQAGGNAEDAIADPTNFYTKDNVTGRGIIMIPNNGPTAAQREAGAILWLGRGYDVIVDFAGFTDEQVINVLNWDAPPDGPSSGDIGLWPQLVRLRGQQRWPIPPR